MISTSIKTNISHIFRKRGYFLQIILTLVLIVTIIFNVVFILSEKNLFKDIDNEYNNNQRSRSRQTKKTQSVEKTDMVKKETEKLVSSRRKIQIEVKSSKNEVFVSIDGSKIYENSADNARGIHIVVLNQNSGIVMSKRIFDTYAPKEDEDMIVYLNSIQEGRIVIFIVKDEATLSLKKRGRNAIKMFGSRLINKIQWRSTWAFISRKYHQWYSEFYHNTESLDKWAKPLIAEATIELDAKTTDCHWGSDEASERRRQFCSKYEGYGAVCSCTDPESIDLHGSPLLGSRVANMPIAVIAANRPNYLYRMLRRLLTTPGVNPNMVTVYIDGFFDEVKALVELFHLQAVEHIPICHSNCRISQHYKRTLRETFDKYPDAEFMIILEEDLDVSVDIMDYFSQLLPVLASDESLYCISAWNDQGYEHSCNDPSLLYRVETMPGLGWVLKKKLFVEELEPKWPSNNAFWDWDMWMRTDGIRKGRECIIPDVSRTYHFGAKGLNMNILFQESYFNNKALNTRTGIKFDIDGITKQSYDDEMNKLIKKAEILDHTKNPCSYSDFVPNTKDHTYVLYMKQDHPRDYETWNNLARCFKLWDVDVRGFHKAMWRFWIRKNRIFVVGSKSPFVKHKPENISPIFIPKRKPKQNTS